jgi:putative transposase
MALRAYRLKHEANKGKAEKVLDLFPAYRDLAEDISRVQWNLFFATGRFDRNLAPLSGIDSLLSERYKQTCQYQVVGMLESFVSNISNDFKQTVLHSSLPEETRVQLLFVNKYRLWFKGEVRLPLFNDGKRVEGEYANVSPETLKLSRRIFKHALSMHRRPSFKGINLALDGKVALVAPRRDAVASRFDYWVRVSTLEKGKPVMIPLRTNGYFEGTTGKLKNFCFVNQKDGGDLEFCLVKEKDSLPYEPMIPELHLDWGLAVAFATQFGDLYGRGFFDELKKRDEMLTALARNRQRQGLRTASSRYRRERRKTREFIRNELCRILNHAVETYRPARIVVEKLDMRSPSLSKRMNRLLTQCGRRAIENKLQCLSEDYGIEIEYVNPAFTSRECSNCGWAEKANRESRDRFTCNNCGLTIHADVNGARVIGSRSSTPLADPYLGRDEILNALRDRFHANVERYPHWPYLDKDNGERRHSPATGSLPEVVPLRQSSKSLCGVVNGIP